MVLALREELITHKNEMPFVIADMRENGRIHGFHGVQGLVYTTAWDNLAHELLAF